MSYLSFRDPSRRVYLAAPYSSDSASVRGWRAGAAGKVAMELILRGHLVYSPISHGHALALQAGCSAPADFAFWRAHCLSFVRLWAELLAVLQLRGWEESAGVKAEIAEARRLGLPVVMLEFDTYGNWHELVEPGVKS